MKHLKLALASVALVSIAGLAQAGGHGITDQSYKAGKVGAHAGFSANPLADCPVELRGIYRGNLYCRQPLLAVNAPRERACPDGVNGMYRGTLYCLTGKN